MKEGAGRQSQPLGAKLGDLAALSRIAAVAGARSSLIGDFSNCQCSLVWRRMLGSMYGKDSTVCWFLGNAVISNLSDKEETKKETKKETKSLSLQGGARC